MNPIDAAGYSDFVVYVDETGDHGLTSIDPQFPMFGLVFCLVRKADYVSTLVPAMQSFKFAVWGHDQVVLHEHDIRKQKPPFGFLRTDPVLRANFMGGLNSLVADAPVELCLSVIDKLKLRQRYARPYNPYQIALQFCMEWLIGRMRFYNQGGLRLPIIVEARGKREDDELKTEFDNICANVPQLGSRTDFSFVEFQLHFADKRSNSTGLQLADLTARPMTLKVLRPDQANRAAEIAWEKLCCLKVFP